jgi:putative FmdB family regulatory protein
MPIYEYICGDCNTKFEALRSISKADEPISCKACESKNTSRKVTAAYAHSNGRAVAGSGPSCSGCSGGSCTTCGV